MDTVIRPCQLILCQISTLHYLTWQNYLRQTCQDNQEQLMNKKCQYAISILSLTVINIVIQTVMISTETASRLDEQYRRTAIPIHVMLTDI